MTFSLHDRLSLIWAGPPPEGQLPVGHAHKHIYTASTMGWRQPQAPVLAPRTCSVQSFAFMITLDCKDTGCHWLTVSSKYRVMPSMHGITIHYNLVWTNKKMQIIPPHFTYKQIIIEVKYVTKLGFQIFMFTSELKYYGYIKTAHKNKEYNSEMIMSKYTLLNLTSSYYLQFRGNGTQFPLSQITHSSNHFPPGYIWSQILSMEFQGLAARQINNVSSSCSRSLQFDEDNNYCTRLACYDESVFALLWS